jgi:hypothetical protein
MFDGNGNWTSDFSAQADRDNGIKILASRFDNIFIADIKESFENCLTKDGQIAPIGNFNMGGQKITNLNNGVNDNDAVNMSQLNNAVSSSVSDLLSSLYPVGSLYITTQNTSSCPIAGLISGSSWSLVAQNRALWGSNGSNGNSTINAGLPNIKGNFQSQCLHFPYDTPYTKGALYAEGLGDSYKQNGGGTDGTNNVTIAFDASRSNSIYGASSTVQPPAYRVNVWRRNS